MPSSGGSQLLSEFELDADKGGWSSAYEGDSDASEHKSSHHNTSTTPHPFAKSKPPSTMTAHPFVKSVENWFSSCSKAAE